MSKKENNIDEDEYVDIEEDYILTENYDGEVIIDNVSQGQGSNKLPKANTLNQSETTQIPSASDYNYDDTSDDDEDSSQNVAERLRLGCECALACFKNLDADQVYRHRLNIAELTKTEHDMYLMGVTLASIANCKMTARKKERQRQRASYVYRGKKVCLEAFLFLENVTLYHLKRIRNHVLTHGVTPRTHGNLGKKPHNAFSLDIYKNVEAYVREYLRPYIEDYSKTQIIYRLSRSEVYNSYKDHGRKPDEKLMGYSTFRHFMKQQFPHVKFQRIDRKNGLINDSNNYTPRNKAKILKIEILPMSSVFNSQDEDNPK